MHLKGVNSLLTFISIVLRVKKVSDNTFVGFIDWCGVIVSLFLQLYLLIYTGTISFLYDSTDI